MSADEDTELRDLVAQTLETNGVLGKIRAQLRASVFLALEEQEPIQNKTPFLNQELKKFISTQDGQNVVGLVREFLDFFNLEFTQAVFEPEAGCMSNYEGRTALAKQLNIQDGHGPAKTPLLLEIMQRSKGSKGSMSQSNGIEAPLEPMRLAEELTPKQLADARKKFDYYDRDKNNEIDKDELRGLFLDMFPNFNRNMLDRYVNDEFRAADRDINNSISFEAFIGMYKRLFLQCRSVVAGNVSDILSPTSPNKSVSSPISKASNSEHSLLNHENGPKQTSLLDNNTDTEEDFFDDPLPTSPGYKSFGSKGLDGDRKRQSASRPSQIPVFSALRSDDKGREKASPTSPGAPKSGNQGRGQSSGMSSLQGLPSLTGDKNTGRKSRQLPVFKHHSQSASSYSAPAGASENLRAMDKRMADLGLDGDAQDYSYEDDFQSEGHSISQKSQRTRSEAKSQNGSIAEEIEEDIDEVSIEGDDFLRSEKSAFDDMTTDRTISQHESGFDYMEELQSP